MYPDNPRRFLLKLDQWEKTRLLGRWRFIVAGAVRDAVATAIFITLLCVSLLGYFSYEDGKTLDCTWFEITGQPGAATVPVWPLCRSLLPVFLVLPLFFWTCARATVWFWNAKVHGQAPDWQGGGQGASLVRIEEEATPLRKSTEVFARLGAALLLFIILSFPALNFWPLVPLPPPEVFDGILCAGIASVALAALFGTIGRVVRGCRAWKTWWSSKKVRQPWPRLRSKAWLTRMHGRCFMAGLGLCVGVFFATVLGLTGRPTFYLVLWLGTACLIISALFSGLAACTPD